MQRQLRPDTRYVFIDIFDCKSEYDFYRSFANEIVKQTSSKIDEWVETAKTFLSNISPKFSFGTDPMNDFSLSFEWSPKDNTEKEILQLPQKIAQKKNIRLVVCLEVQVRVFCQYPICQKITSKERYHRY